MDDENQSECQSQQLLNTSPLIWNNNFQLSNYDQNQELEELSGERNDYEKQYYNFLMPVYDKKNQSAFKWYSDDEQSYWSIPINPGDPGDPVKSEDPVSPLPFGPEDPVQPLPLDSYIKKDRQKKQPKFPNKSFCRYILLYAFRALEKQQYIETIQEICIKNNVNFELFRAYYTKQRLVIQGYQVLKKELITKNDNVKEVVQRKKAFQEYLIWYLEKIATKDILSSKKKDLKEYIKFKNEVMYYYIRFPNEWNGNKAEWL